VIEPARNTLLKILAHHQATSHNPAIESQATTGDHGPGTANAGHELAKGYSLEVHFSDRDVWNWQINRDQRTRRSGLSGG
jgi:hypothetical protein